MSDTITDVIPSALPPTEEELAAWRALSREDQIARYREALQAPDTQRISSTTMADIREAAHKRVAARCGSLFVLRLRAGRGHSAPDFCTL